MKQIAFLVTDHGIDGRSPETIVFASLDENRRNKWYNQSPNKAWYTTTERVVDLDAIANETFKKLNHLEKVAIFSAWEKIKGNKSFF